MKNIFRNLAIFCFMFLVFGCDKDESLDPRPIFVPGVYVRLDITSKRLNFDKLSTTYFGGKLTAPAGNISKYVLYVRQRDNFGYAGDFKEVRTVTQFPYDLRITPDNIATSLGVPVTSLKFGDNFRFYGESYAADGTRTDWYSLAAVVQAAPSMKQAYRFITDMANNSGFPGTQSGQLNYDEYDNYQGQ